MGGLPCSPQHFHKPLLQSVYSMDRWEPQSSFDYVFMTVRNPIDRLRSEFRYRSPWDVVSKLQKRAGKDLSFDRWIKSARTAYRRNAFALDNHLRPQVEFEAFGCEIFRLEDGLAPVATRLSEVTGVGGRLPTGRVNEAPASGRFNYALSPKSQLWLGETYGVDAEKYGYPSLSVDP